jgi:hypothetical protein
MQGQPIPGGSCPILPLQLCIIWATAEEGAVTKLARDVWFAALIVQFWRCKNKPGQPYRPSPRGFRIADIAKVLGVEETKLRGSLQQLDQAGILRITEKGPWFATDLADLSIPDSIRVRIHTMFDQLGSSHEPRFGVYTFYRLLAVIQCR